MKKLVFVTLFTLSAITSYGQSYNNIQNYSLINGLVGCTRQAATMELVKAGYKLMTYQEVCQKEGEIFPKDFFAISTHYRYVGSASRGKSPYYCTVVFDPDHGNKSGMVEWNEYMTPGRGKVLDAVVRLHNLVLSDQDAGGSATIYTYKNDLRYLIFTGYPNNQLVKFQIAVNRGDLSGN
ncbi:MAG: hypothetical protein ACRYFX_15700 [Janthinobacterium lividum]